MSPISLPFSGAGPLFLFLAKATLLLVAALVATMSARRSTAGARHLDTDPVTAAVELSRDRA